MKKRGNREFSVLCITVLITVTFLSIINSPVLAHITLVDQAPPSATSISCSVSSSSMSLGDSLTSSGSITPSVANATVTLTYIKPDKATVDHTVVTGADGSYSDTYTPDASGSWAVYSSWAGNDNYFGATSFNAPFTVNAASTTNTTYIYLAIIVIVIVIVAVAVLLLRKKKKP